MAELVGNDALRLIARKLLRSAAGDADHGITRRVSRRESIYATFFVEQENRWHGHPGSESHLFDHVQQPAFGRVGGIRVYAPAAEPLGDYRAAARELRDFVRAAAAN